MTEPKRAELLSGVIHPWDNDHFGHMNVRQYSPFFDAAGHHRWVRPGIGYDRMPARHGAHCVMAQGSSGFVKELVASEQIAIDGRVKRIGTKSATLMLEMRHVETRALDATSEVVEVFFDPKTHKAAVMPVAACAVMEEWVGP